MVFLFSAVYSQTINVKDYIKEKPKEEVPKEGVALTPTPKTPRVAAFYYPWYRTPDVDAYWDHWGETNFHPPLDIASDFYPALGPYSIADPAIVAQHFAWLREAGVDIIVSSWWGQRSREDQAVPLLLDIAERYGIKVAFHIEPYDGRTGARLVNDINYLYSHYGDHPAFYRTTASSRWSPDDRPKGLFYLWSSLFPDPDSDAVEPNYWRNALDAIHALPDGGLVLADQTVSEWVDGGHFDGLYNYGVLNVNVDTGYSWARDLPPEAWYVPGVNPGFSARRIKYPPDVNTPRRNGATYNDRWEAALSVGVEPELVTITTFNEWHEGTQIEPAAVGVSNGLGYNYEDYGSLPPEGYLTLTSQWVTRFLATSWPETKLMRVRLVTTSDWTVFSLVSGATWLRPNPISASEKVTNAKMYDGRFVLEQPIDRAKAGEKAEMIVDILFTAWESGGKVVFEIERGDLGSTQVELFKYVEGEPVIMKTFKWGRISGDGRNASTIKIPAEELFGATP
jgi:glycoprotein endo-alpha-1,2-mannosidase